MVAVALIAFFCVRLSHAAISKERPVNVLHDDEDGDGSYQGLPHYYVPEPYLVSDSNNGGTSGAASTSNRLFSMTPADILHTQGTAAAATTMRKNALPATLRPKNVIQHDDAGPREGTASVGEPEMIELPSSSQSSSKSAGLRILTFARFKVYYGFDTTLEYIGAQLPPFPRCVIVLEVRLTLDTRRSSPHPRLTVVPPCSLALAIRSFPPFLALLVAELALHLDSLRIWQIGR
ncbi:hypothetical protein EI94DRAFT_1854592 [Lactarius quietus]|nr:hypothetical protein EI94DRAFT_1854592 [Lactarius quietus]